MKIKNNLFFIFFTFLLFWSIFLPHNSFAQTVNYCQQAEGCFDPGGAGEQYSCQNSGSYACDCGGSTSECVSNGSYDCGRGRYPEYGITCSAGERCECGAPVYQTPPPTLTCNDVGAINYGGSLPCNYNTYPNSYPPSYAPNYPGYNAYNTYPPGYNSYNDYPQYPEYPSYNGYPSYPSYNSYNTYNSYNSYNSYNTYPNTYNTYPPSFSLTVTKTGGGSIKSVDTFINCGTTCSKTYVQGTNVTLKATPSSSYWKFSGWSGDCSGAGDCVLNINSAKSVTGKFVPRNFIYKEF